MLLFLLCILLRCIVSVLDLSYNIALCYYSMKQYAPALKHIADIIEKGIREHPGEFDIATQTNTQSLIQRYSSVLMLHSI